MYKSIVNGPLTVGEASDPSESSDGNMRHIPIHAEGEGGGGCRYTGRSGVAGRHPSSHLLTPATEPMTTAVSRTFAPIAINNKRLFGKDNTQITPQHKCMPQQYVINDERHLKQYLSHDNVEYP